MRTAAVSETIRSPTTEALRQRLRGFLAQNEDRPRGLRGAEKIAWQKDWTARLADEGLAGPSWPTEVGGMGLDLAGQLVYHQELVRANAPGHPSPIAFIVAPTIIRHGTDAQRERYLRPILRADELWCQGFSEPGAGSDLPSLNTRAVLDGEHYRVTGQKVWTTGAEVADWMFALVRTGEPGSHSAGISYLLLAMDSPGITVRPLRDITGRAHFSEVFLDDVEVPVGQRVGEENKGWEIARTSLGHERTTMSLSADLRYRRIVTELFGLARTTGAIDDPGIRQALGRSEAGVRILAARAQATLASVLAGQDPGNSASVNRLFRAVFEQDLHELALAIIGPDAMLAADAPQSPERGRWTTGYLATRASTIGAGTAEIQRNTIAEKVLDLPRVARRS
jgi:alkylation response protein AidB-like acyl-CoA dehydrogenase